MFYVQVDKEADRINLHLPGDRYCVHNRYITRPNELLILLVTLSSRGGNELFQRMMFPIKPYMHTLCNCKKF